MYEENVAFSSVTLHTVTPGIGPAGEGEEVFFQEVVVIRGGGTIKDCFISEIPIVEFRPRAMSLMNIKNKNGSRTLPWGTPLVTLQGADISPSITTCFSRPFIQ